MDDYKEVDDLNSYLMEKLDDGTALYYRAGEERTFEVRHCGVDEKEVELCIDVDDYGNEIKKIVPVKIDSKTNEPSWVVSVPEQYTKTLTDEKGHKIECLVSDSDFKLRYERYLPTNDIYYMQKRFSESSAANLYIKVPDNIRYEQNGEVYEAKAGDVIAITNQNADYPIPAKVFKMMYSRPKYIAGLDSYKDTWIEKGQEIIIPEKHEEWKKYIETFISTEWDRDSSVISDAIEVIKMLENGESIETAQKVLETYSYSDTDLMLSMILKFSNKGPEFWLKTAPPEGLTKQNLEKVKAQQQKNRMLERKNVISVSTEVSDAELRLPPENYKQNEQCKPTDLFYLTNGREVGGVKVGEIENVFEKKIVPWYTDKFELTEEGIYFMPGGFPKNSSLGYAPDYTCDNNFAIRPVLISKTIIDNLSDDVDEIEFGEYPQYAPSENIQKELDKELKNGTLKKSGNTYTFNDTHSTELLTQPDFVPLICDEYEYQGKKYVHVKVTAYNEESVELSNGVTYKDGDNVWIEVSPVRWLVDKKAGILIAKEGILSGVKYGPKNGSDDLMDSCMQKFLNDCLLPELTQNASNTKLKGESKDDSGSKKV